VRAERLLRILLLLQSRGRLTVAELARRLEVSPRTVQRDLEAMSLAGVPVYPTRGRGGGWSLLPDFRTRLFGLTAAEAMSIFVGTTTQVLTDLGLGETDRAYDKLLTALPAGIRREAGFALQRVLIDRPGWDEDLTDDVSWLAVCRQALWEERLMIMRYGSGRAAITVAPLGLVAKGHAWYLVAWRDTEPRTYRVSRIVSAEPTDESFDRPTDFDLADYWAESVRRTRAEWPSYPVVFIVRDSALARFSGRRGVRITSDPNRPGWSRVEIDLENPGEARSVALGLGGAAIVEEPVELRQDVRRAAEELVRLHDQQPDGS
jgi:predicted DNA-binding transcriptional regulator YafY